MERERDRETERERRFMDNPIKTVGRDSFLSPKTPKTQAF